MVMIEEQVYASEEEAEAEGSNRSAKNNSFTGELNSRQERMHDSGTATPVNKKSNKISELKHFNGTAESSASARLKIAHGL